MALYHRNKYFIMSRGRQDRDVQEFENFGSVGLGPLERIWRRF